VNYITTRVAQLIHQNSFITSTGLALRWQSVLVETLIVLAYTVIYTQAYAWKLF
jgi:hypothetical protein